ncbi:Inorganic phosphate transporter 1-4 [Linum perenne]
MAIELCLRKLLILSPSLYIQSPKIVSSFNKQSIAKGNCSPRGIATVASNDDVGSMEVLNALDVAKTQWYHFTTVVVAGMGFFTDAYDLFCISLVTKLLGRIYTTSTDPRSQAPSLLTSPPPLTALCSAAHSPDSYSSASLVTRGVRKKVYGITLMDSESAAVFAMQGFGILAEGIFAIVISSAFNSAFKSPPYDVDPVGSTVP